MQDKFEEVWLQDKLEVWLQDKDEEVWLQDKVEKV